jgi:hypothetical protein
MAVAVGCQYHDPYGRPSFVGFLASSVAVCPGLETLLASIRLTKIQQYGESSTYGKLHRRMPCQVEAGLEDITSKPAGISETEAIRRCVYVSS